jgi:non-specific serine/threonine protein kinase
MVDAAARAALGDLAPAGGGTGRGVPAGRGDLADAVAAWRGALTGRRRTFDADPSTVAALVAQLATWQRDAVGGAVRACFRLVEPPASPEPDPPRTAGGGGDPGGGGAEPAGSDPYPADETWRVEFAMQAADDPSLIIAAEQVWSAPGALTALARHVAAPQETMLAELGRASRLWPELDPALRSARPDGLDLDAAGAYHFLRERAPLLASAGFGVLLPAWWTRPGARLGARLAARSAGAGTAPGTVAKPSGFGLDAITEYRWEVALGDQTLSERELMALAELRAPLVRVRGQWAELDPAKLAAGLKLLRTDGRMSVGELLRAGLSTEEGGPGGLPVLQVRAEGKLGDLLAGAVDQRLDPVDAPEGFEGRLRPYQQRGLAWMTFLQSLGLGGVLADDMGLGKTVQMLALIAGDGSDAGPTLLICPMSLVGNWRREAERFVPGLRVHVHHGAERARGEEFAEAVGRADLVLTTYALAARDAEALGEVRWHRLVIDEAQAIKNAATRQASAVRAIPARHRVAMTGTPVENRLADLWSIMEFANPGLLGTAAQFKRRYAEPVERRGDELAAQRLRRITGPFVLRRVKTDRTIIADLPEKLEMEVLCNLTAE